MRKFEIHLNDEKILADGKYTPEQVHNALDVAFESVGIDKAENGVYVGKGTDKDTDSFIAMYFFLLDTKWCVDYIDKWIAYNNDSMEDVLEEKRKFNMRKH